LFHQSSESCEIGLLAQSFVEFV
jgi:hypothetical protein